MRRGIAKPPAVWTSGYSAWTTTALSLTLALALALELAPSTRKQFFLVAQRDDHIDVNHLVEPGLSIPKLLLVWRCPTGASRQISSVVGKKHFRRSAWHFSAFQPFNQSLTSGRGSPAVTRRAGKFSSDCERTCRACQQALAIKGARGLESRQPPDWCLWRSTRYRQRHAHTCKNVFTIYPFEPKIP